MSTDLSLSGLASGFDWKTFINQIMAVQNAPINKLNAQKVTNTNKNAALVDVAFGVASCAQSDGAADGGDSHAGADRYLWS